MAWDYQNIFTGDTALVLPVIFTSQLLAINVSIDNQKSTWYRAGYLQALIDIDGVQFLGRKFTLEFGGQLIEIPYASYLLRFQPVQWTQNTDLKIRQLSTPEIKTIMPLYSAMPTSIADQPVLDSIPTTFAAPAYLAANPASTYQALAANAARQSYAVTNLGTVPVFLDLDAPTAATKRFVTVPVNGTYVSDITYVGAVFIWSSSAAAQSCEVREFIQ